MQATYLPRQRSSVCFFTTQLSKSPLWSPEPAVPKRPSPCPSGTGGTEPHQSTRQHPQWRQVALPPSQRRNCCQSSARSKKRGKKPKSCQKCFCKASVNGGGNASCYLLTARSRTFRSVLKSLKPKSILPTYQIWDVLPVYILNGELKKRKEWNTSKLLIAYKPTIFGKFCEIFDWLLYNESQTQAPHQGITDADDQSVWFSLIAYVFKLFDFRSNEITRHFHFTLNVCVINS